jgi:hypothetical protein
MASSKKIAILSLITVFIVGLAAGVALDRFVFDKKRPEHRRRDPNEFLFEKFTRELSLTKAQQDTLQMLLDDIKEKHKVLSKKRHEEYDKIRQEFEIEFRKILTSEQLNRYNEMIRQFEERRKRKEEERQKGDKKSED